MQGPFGSAPGSEELLEERLRKLKIKIISHRLIRQRSSVNELQRLLVTKLSTFGTEQIINIFFKKFKNMLLRLSFVTDRRTSTERCESSHQHMR